MLARYLERLSTLDYRTREQQRLRIVGAVTLVSVLLSLLITFGILRITSNSLLPIIFIIATIAPGIIAPITTWHIAGLIIRVQKLEASHRQQATIDDLTGLLSRRALLTQGESVLRLCERNRQPLSLAMLDLDRFKNVNDRFGHAGGDEVLKAFADILRRRLRTSDVVGRLGGEEFAIALPGTGLEDARRILDQLREEVALTEIPYLSQRIRVTVSLGLVSTLGEQEEDFSLLLRAADDALYKAKEQGRNRLVVLEDKQGVPEGYPGGSNRVSSSRNDSTVWS